MENTMYQQGHTKRVHIKYFASVREALDLSEQTWQTQARSVGALREELRTHDTRYASALDTNKAVRVARNHVLCEEDALLHDGDEVAFFPPVTGG